MDAPIRTAYFMTYSRLGTGKCLADCSFCTLASSSASSPDYLSRVRWMPYELEEVVKSMALRKHRFGRVCLQVVNYPGFLRDVFTFLESMAGDKPVSVSIMPVGKDNYSKFKSMGVDRVAIPMDAATPVLFDAHKGRGGFYRWGRHLEAIREAVEVFGRGNVVTYLIVGLGETDEEAIKFIVSFRDLGVHVALHSFTAVPGLRIEGAETPSLERYRSVQLARFLLYHRKAQLENFVFEEGHLAGIVGVDDLKSTASSPLPYLTTGCPDCNRPFYNERVRGPLYNLPAIKAGR